MALATSKRKFYKLLDNLSRSNLSPSSPASANASETSLSINPTEDNLPQASHDRPVKRARMPTKASTSRPALAPIRRKDTATIEPSRTSVRVISSNFESRNSPAGTAKSQSASNVAVSIKPSTIKVDRSDVPSVYAPWNHEHFLARLKTFADVKTWNPKPKSIDEVTWAKRGWMNIGPEEVSCRSCGKRLVVKLEAKPDSNPVQDSQQDDGEQRWWIEEAEKSLVEKYESLVVDGHAEGCLWKKGGCKGLSHCS
jgi:C3HC zinc finger-like